MRIQVKVKSNCRTEEISRQGDVFIVKVKEPPREGRANRAVIKLLAEHLGLPQSSVKIVSGLRSRSKLIDVAEH
ncbi:MAG: DUF167 domain-containing protein [Dehalococcoidia bacterium]